MRVGHNPAKSIWEVAQPRDLSVTIVNFIPVLRGFHQDSLKVLQACLESIRATLEVPFDLMVFDNHSCPEVREYLFDMLKQDQIQYLVLSDTNIGKIGAWNYLFGAAQGRYIAYADSDALFRPGWLQDAMAIFDTYPKVGMVTGCPMRNSERSINAVSEAWGRQQGVLQEGTFVRWEDYLELALAVGKTEEEAKDRYEKDTDYLMDYRGQKAMIGASHFQFVALGEVLKKLIPMPSNAPMRGEIILDRTINDMGLMRLASVNPYVLHMGNRVETLPNLPAGAPKRRRSLLHRIIWLPGIRRVVHWLYHRLFRLIYDSVE